MKKIFTLLVLCVIALAAQAKDITIYVQATKAPYIWAWESGTGGKVLSGSKWPGVQMSLKKTVKDTEFWYITFTTEKTINVIFNDGGTDGQGTAAKQTGDINDISSDHYFTYDGARSAVDVTEQYAELPDAVIDFLALTGTHKPNTDTNDVFTALGDNKYQLYVDLTGVELLDEDPLSERWEFWIRPNGQGWVNEGNGTVVQDPDGVLDHEDPSNQNFVVYLNDIHCYQFTITATWTVGKSSLTGWTVRIEKGNTTGIDAIEHGTLNIEHSVYDLQGRRVSKPTKGLYIVNGKKVVIK